MTVVDEPGAASPEIPLTDLQRRIAIALTGLGLSDAEQQSSSPHPVPDEPSASSLDFDELPKLISVATAAQVLGVSRASAYRYAAGGELPTVHLGGRLYVVTARLKALLDAA